MNEVCTVLAVTIERVSADTLAVLNPMKGFDSQEEKAGAAWAVTIVSPLLPLSWSLSPSPSVGESSCASRALGSPAVRTAFLSHRSGCWLHGGVAWPPHPTPRPCGRDLLEKRKV